jgi:hypothetical protein
VNPLEYLNVAFADAADYLWLLAVSALVHAWLLKRFTHGLFDPLFFVLLGSMFGWAVVGFMALHGDIAVGYAVSFAIAETSFCLGLAAFHRRVPATLVRQPSAEPPGFAIAVFTASAVTHVASTLATWAIVGIPLFLASRLGAFAQGGGLGVIERLADGGGSIALFAALYLLFGNRRVRHRAVYAGFVAWYLVAVALSGSKSSFLIVGQCVFAVAFLYTDLARRLGAFWGGRAGVAFIVVAIAFALGVLAVQQDDWNPTVALFGLVYRLITYGDIYVFAYPGAAIESLTGRNPLIGLFGGILSTFRLFPPELVYPNLGYQFALMTFPELDIVVGPNPRHPVFGYHYFGAFAWVFSFLLGAATALSQRALYARRRTEFLGALVAFLVYSALNSISVDFEYALTRLASAAIALVFVVVPALALHPRAVLLRLGRPLRPQRSAPRATFEPG